MKASKDEMGLKMADFLVKECQEWLKSFMALDQNPYALTHNEAFALGLYTYDLGLVLPSWCK